jgi:hypothetical protein
MFIISSRYSEAVEFVAVNPFKRTALVRFTSGGEYFYRNVSRTKLLALMLQKDISLGFWVQSLRKNAVVQRNYNDRTGVMTYELVGSSVSSRTLPVLLQQHESLSAV